MIEPRIFQRKLINTISEEYSEQKLIPIKEFKDINVVINCFEKFGFDLDSNYFSFNKEKPNKKDSLNSLCDKNSWDSFNFSYEKFDEEKEFPDKKNFILLEKETKSAENILSSEDWIQLLNRKNINIFTLNREKLVLSLMHGVPKTLRGRIWKFLSNSKNISLNHDKSFFNSLLEIKNVEVEKQIRKDIERTSLSDNSSHNCLDEDKIKSDHSEIEIKNKLSSILRAYAIYDPQVGYCQGTNFIVMVLLSNITSVTDAFWTFVQIMHDKNWRLMFINNTPKLMKAFDKLLESIRVNVKELYEHFERENFIEFIPGVFTHFFTTLFSYNAPVEYCNRVLDLFWFYEDKIILDCIVHLLKLKTKDLVKMSTEELIVFIKNDLVYSCIKDYSLERCLPIGNYLIKEREVSI